MLEQFLDPDNRLFLLARSGVRMTRWWLIPILLFVFLFAGAGGQFFPLELASEVGLWESTFDTTAFLIVGYAPVAILVGVWLWFFEKRSPRTLGMEPGNALRYGLAGFGLGAGLMGLGTVLLITSGDARLEFEQSANLGWSVLAPALLILVGWAVQGLTEEIIFRGWMLQNTGAQLGPLTGIIAANIIFSLAHLANPGLTVLGAFNLVLIGILFTLVALLEGGIWAVSGLHIAWNWTQSNIFGFKVSGLDIGGGSFVTVLPDETSSITGGEFGFEGSVAATITIVIGMLLVLAVASRREGFTRQRSRR